MTRDNGPGADATLRVVLVDDSPVNTELAREVLETAGFSVLCAATAEEGIQLARRHHPDVVLMDIGLPKMDGLQATRLLKADPDTQHLVVVALTAHAMMGEEERARAAGCDGYLTKPLDTRRFAAQVLELASRYRSGRDRP